MNSMDDLPNQTGVTVFISGANSGIGLESAKAFARSGAQVLMGCRDPQRGESARAEVARAAAATAPDPVLLRLDLADLSSVRAVAAEVAEAGTVIDVLMLNAGVMAMPRGRTSDGFELHFGINHLGHFALAGLLMPSVLAAASPRVVTTASLAHWAGHIRWTDPNFSGRFYWAFLAYAQSKLANLIFMGELGKRAHAAGLPLISTSARPGASRTGLATQNEHPLVKFGYGLAHKYAAQPAAMGALPQLYAATMPGVRSGSYWGPDGRLERQGHPAPAQMSRAATRDPSAGRRLWELSERLTGVSFGGAFNGANLSLPSTTSNEVPNHD